MNILWSPQVEVLQDKNEKLLKDSITISELQKVVTTIQNCLAPYYAELESKKDCIDNVDGLHPLHWVLLPILNLATQLKREEVEKLNEESFLKEFMAIMEVSLEEAGEDCQDEKASPKERFIE